MENKIVSAACKFIEHQNNEVIDSTYHLDDAEGTPCVFFYDYDEECHVLASVRASNDGLPEGLPERKCMEALMADALAEYGVESCSVRFDDISMHIFDIGDDTPNSGRALLRHHKNIAGGWCG